MVRSRTKATEFSLVLVTNNFIIIYCEYLTLPKEYVLLLQTVLNTLKFISIARAGCHVDVPLIFVLLLLKNVRMHLIENCCEI